MPKRIQRKAPIYNLDGTITVDLTRGYTTVIDAVDADLIPLKWRANGSDGNIYAGRTDNKLLREGKSFTQLMHRVILSRKLGRELLIDEHTDHVNLNKLDNRRSNLRLATREQNAHNRQYNRKNKSGYCGVTPYKDKWKASIQVDHKFTNLGVFDTPEEAAEVYRRAAMELQGEFYREQQPKDMPMIQLPLPLDQEAA